MSKRGTPPPYEHAQVIQRIAFITGLASDAAIAEELGASPQSFAAWKRRATVPYERICEFALRRNISLDWLLLGKGEPRPAGQINDWDLFAGIASQIYAAVQGIAGASRIDYKIILDNAIGIYDRALRAPLADRSGAVDHEVSTRMAAFAHALASVLRDKKASKQEIERVERLARQFEKGD